MTFKRTQVWISTLGLFFLLIGQVMAQGIATPLSYQGLERFFPQGARARAMGSVIIGDGRDASALFTDPAALARLERPEVRLGGSFTSLYVEQSVRWIPNRLYAEISLVLENDPEKLVRTVPFDDIRPDWDYRRNLVRPGVLALAVPFTLGKMALTAGLGFGKIITPDHYYQNNNALDPNIGRLRPAPIPRVREGDSLLVNWFQFSREREGTIYGLTPAVALQRGAFSFGASLTILTGSTRDQEYRRGRGLFTLRYNNNFSLDPSPLGETSMDENASYSGVRTTLSGRFDHRHLSLGVVLRPAFTLKRTWGDVSDELHIPTQVTVGMALYPTSVWRLVLDYDLHRLKDAEYVPEGGTAFNPWVHNSVFHFGIEYQPIDWLALRGGYHRQPQGFAPEGSAFLDDPAMASVYAGGVGIFLGPFVLDLTYERFVLSYDDLWISNDNTNRVQMHSIFFEAAYRF